MKLGLTTEEMRAKYRDLQANSPLGVSPDKEFAYGQACVVFRNHVASCAECERMRTEANLCPEGRRLNDAAGAVKPSTGYTLQWAEKELQAAKAQLKEVGA